MGDAEGSVGGSVGLRKIPWGACGRGIRLGSGWYPTLPAEESGGQGA